MASLHVGIDSFLKCWHEFKFYKEVVHCNLHSVNDKVRRASLTILLTIHPRKASMHDVNLSSNYVL